MQHDPYHPKHHSNGTHDRHMMMTTKFGVVIDKIHLAYFTKVGGLQIQTAMDEVKEGGVNSHSWFLPARTTLGNKITLSKGVVQNDLLWNWYMEVIQGGFEPRTVRIHAHENVQTNKRASQILVAWVLHEALPVQWTGPSFDTGAGGEGRAVQQLTFMCNGITRQMGDQPDNLGDSPA